MRDARTGQMVTVRERSHEPVPKEIGRALAMSTNSVAVVLDAARAAASESRSAGTALQFVVEGEPSGRPRIVEAFGDLPEASAEQSDLQMDTGEAPGWTRRSAMRASVVAMLSPRSSPLATC